MRIFVTITFVLLIFLSFCLITAVPETTWDDVFKAYQKFNKAERDLGNAINHLGFVYTEQGLVKVA